MNIYEINEDWENVKKRYESWWECELYDRPLIQVHAPKIANIIRYEPGKVEPIQQGNTNFELRRTNAEYMIEKTFDFIRHTYHGGESVPVFYHGWSVGNAVILGCKPHFMRETIWVDPLPVECDGYPDLKFNQSNHWWKWMLQTTEKMAQASKGCYYVWPTWGSDAGDNLLLARGTQQLMIDIYENPEWVKRSVRFLSDMLIDVFDKLWELVSLTGLNGSVNAMRCWSPYKTLCVSCDLSYMISTDDFKEIFLPPLVETMRTVEHRIYHLDGVGALRHLDTLLDMPELQAIQWAPGAGREEIMQWVPVIKRIQKKRKSIVIQTSPNEIEPLLKEISPKGLCIFTRCSSEDDARKLIEHIEKIF